MSRSLPISASDRRTWRELVAIVRRHLHDPTTGLRSLDHAAKRAYRTRLPCPPFARGNPFEQLVEQARRYVAQPTRLDRDLVRPAMRSALERCTTIWPEICETPAPVAAPQAAWTQRRDIGGDDE